MAHEPRDRDRSRSRSRERDEPSEFIDKLVHINRVAKVVKGGTVVAASSMEKTLRDGGKTGANVDAAKAVGKLVAERAVEKGVTDVVFDRGRYLYHGRVKALADAAREAGLKF